MSTAEIANIYSSINNIQLGLNDVTGNTFSNYNQLSRIVSQQANIYNTLYYGTGNMSTGFLSVGANCNITGNLIISNGNVGIWTSSPSANLDVQGNARINGNLMIGNGNLFMNRFGNLGIGTTNPLATLDISGNARITGNVSVGSWNSSSATHLGYQALSGSASTAWTGIPSWANETTISIESASTTVSATILVQIGISSGYVTTGYYSSTWSPNNGTIVNTTGGTIWAGSGSASDSFNGTLKFIYMGTNGSTYYYDITGTGVGVSSAGTPYATSTWGRIATTEKINSIRITTSTGNLDAGIAGVYYF